MINWNRISEYHSILFQIVNLFRFNHIKCFVCGSKCRNADNSNFYCQHVDRHFYHFNNKTKEIYIQYYLHHEYKSIKFLIEDNHVQIKDGNKQYIELKNIKYSNFEELLEQSIKKYRKIILFT